MLFFVRYLIFFKLAQLVFLFFLVTMTGIFKFKWSELVELT